MHHQPYLPCGFAVIGVVVFLRVDDRTPLFQGSHASVVIFLAERTLPSRAPNEICLLVGFVDDRRHSSRAAMIDGSIVLCVDDIHDREGFSGLGACGRPPSLIGFQEIRMIGWFWAWHSILPWKAHRVDRSEWVKAAADSSHDDLQDSSVSPKWQLGDIPILRDCGRATQLYTDAGTDLGHAYVYGEWSRQEKYTARLVIIKDLRHALPWLIGKPKKMNPTIVIIDGWSFSSITKSVFF